MNIFKVPSTNYTDHYDLARFSLSWRVCAFMSFTLVVLGAILLALGQPAYLPTFIGAAFVISFLLILKSTRKYNFVAIFFSIVGTVLCQFTLLYFIGEYHMVDVLWVMVIGLYTFFMLGKAWGVFILMLNLTGIILFLFLRLNENLPLIGQLEDGKVMALAFNFAICMKLIIFLILQFLNVIKKAENDLRAVNKELVDQNNTIISQNQEKTVMLREIHHRVKNNLQVITSLLRLQSMEIEDSESKTKFNETIDRVRSIANIHERMYLSENLSKIDLEGYINSLAEDLIQSYRVKRSIALEVECELHHIHPKSLVSVALIFNELISNSLKHAFPTVENPEIQILIKLQDNNAVMIHYRDNGKWKEQSNKSFGLELIDSLTEQLNGSLSIQKVNGTHFHFQFDQKSIVEDDQ